MPTRKKHPKKNACLSKQSSLFLCGLAYASALAVVFALHSFTARLSPVLAVLILDVAATSAVFVFSMGLNNSSVYDPYWSVAPALILFHWWLRRPASVTVSPRFLVLLGLVLVWGIRLTANWIRRWPGMHHEDFRYRDIREWSGRMYWPASFLGIHLFPTLIVFTACLPAYKPVISSPDLPFVTIPVIAGIAVMLLAVMIEGTADRQLHAYQGKRKKTGEVLREGMWKYSRHPNYLGEILFWWGVWIYSMGPGELEPWTLAGPVLMTVLFLFVSIPMMDRHMLKGHREYRKYKKATSALIPWPPRRG